MNILTTEHLGRRVGERKLVDDINVEVAVGEVLAIVGPSGAGKSSFLRLLNRLDEPTSGTVFLDNVDYHQIPPRELRRHVGMVTQRAFLFPGTVYDNVIFGPQQRGEMLSQDRMGELLSPSFKTSSARAILPASSSPMTSPKPLAWHRA
jgi:putative ABC transport system ATP-binding protein